jgi:hypothetical protein
MIKLFRNSRRTSIGEEPSLSVLPTVKYMKYAIGEIVLVVVGILIALQINNWNASNKTRAKELHYLENIKTDLIINIEEMNNYLDTRTKNMEAASRIIEQIEGIEKIDYSALNADAMGIYGWQKFYQNNNTFQELLNSGNLALVSNDSIKNLLLDIESLYKKMKSEEDHFRFDTEELIYKPLYATMDLNPLLNNYIYRVSNGNSGIDNELTEEMFDEYLTNVKVKNGFVMTVLEFGTLNKQMNKMIGLSEKLITSIDKELVQN